MIDLPIGKALIAEYFDIQCGCECEDENYHCTIDCCKECKLDFDKIGGFPDDDVCGCLCCAGVLRRDGKQVIYKLVDYP